MSVGVTGANSYLFDQFTAGSREAEGVRLRRQAQFARELERSVLSRKGITVDADCVEIGCGPGFVSGLIAELAPQGQVVGVDLSRELLRAAREWSAPHHPNLRFVEGDALDLPLADGTFDFAYSRLLYQHLPEPVRAAREALRVLRAGGRLVVVDVDAAWQSIWPACPAFDRLNALACEAQAAAGGDRFIGRRLPAVLQEAGFREVRMEVLTLSSFEHNLETFLDVTTGFKSLQVGTDEARALMGEVHRHMAAPPQSPAYILSSVFVATGVRP
jgi:SAM-dependent methyltransferase